MNFAKFLIINFFVLIGLFTCFHAKASMHKDNLPMEGELDDIGARSIITKSLQVSLDESILTIEFAQYVPDVTISIKDNSGNLIYIKSYTAPETEVISLAELEPGSYMLELTTERGGYISGSFFYN